MHEKRIRVRMAELMTGNNPDIIVTIGLGSCVGIAIYDKFKKIGGLLHIMLPENKKDMKPAKYADTGIPLLITQMEELGSLRRNMEAKIAGGAHMFSSADFTIKVGERNIEAVRNVLARENIRITGEDVGNDYGRTMELYTEDGTVLIKSFKKGKKII